MGRICLVFLSYILYFCDTVRPDPCESYSEIWSPTLQASVNTIGWYRFVNTSSGVLANSCPSQDVCDGTNGVIWVKDQPVLNSTVKETSITICLRKNDNCCGEENRIKMKICNGYTVYLLVKPRGTDMYCFNSTETVHQWTTNQSHTTKGTDLETSTGHEQPSSSSLTSSITRELPTTESEAFTVVDSKETATSAITPSKQTQTLTPNSLNEIKPSSGDDSSKTTRVIVIVVVVALVIVAIITVVVVLMRRQRRKSIEVTKLAVEMRKK